jgi:PleD family two-component response regulator
VPPDKRCPGEKVKKKSNEATKILLIGPNTDTALFTALQREGYDTLACESPQEAAARIGEFRPHLIVVHLSPQADPA